MKSNHLDTIYTYNTISEFLTSIGFPKSQETDFTISQLEGYHGNQAMESSAFRTNYFAFLLITSGTGSYTIDSLQFPLEPVTFYFTNPGHLKSFSISEPWKGFIMSVTDNFIKQYFAGDLYKEFPFLVAETTPAVKVSGETAEDLSFRFQTILKEYQSRSSFKFQMINHFLIAFLYKIKELIQTTPALKGHSFGYSPLVIQFRKMLDYHFREIIHGEITQLHKLNQFADRLFVHPNYLGSLVKKETGKTVSQWISQRVITEAQSLLQNTTLSIAEISYQLTFKEPTNFTKYFKKQTGFTPKEYRESL